jgi:hypothetical protein
MKETIILILTIILHNCVFPTQVVGQISFNTHELEGASPFYPTCIQFGPDSRLYISSATGLITIYTVIRGETGLYEVIDEEVIELINDIPNHNDNGSLNTEVTFRLITGMLVTGTPNSPIIYISSSDPRTNEQDEENLGQPTWLDTNSGIISKVERVDGIWVRTDVVRGLPRSEEVHATNGMQLDEETNTLYVAQGGHTNMGAPSYLFSYVPEYALSACVLAVNLNEIGETTYDLPTLNDEDRDDLQDGNPGFEDPNDPFGGNRGKNMAMWQEDSPVQVYASGFRNPYDLLLKSNGKIYLFDNGPNGGYGSLPENCTNDTLEGGASTDRDGLFLIRYPGYYAGHCNPVRGNPELRFNNSNPQMAISEGLINPDECIYYWNPDTLVFTEGSTNGICEYTASNFNGAMQGEIIAACLDGELLRIRLNEEGDAIAPGGLDTLASNFCLDPLDVVAQGDDDLFPGTVWTVCFGSNSVHVFEPSDYEGQQPDCTPVIPSEDSDADCYSNADEYANGTNPCNAADRPSDFDSDCLSDLLDPDDDDDGIPDELDIFALDPLNGNGTFIPQLLDFNNTDQGGLNGWGFTGLMNNGLDNYMDQYQSGNVTVGSAVQMLTVTSIPTSGPDHLNDDQQYGFHFGVNVSSQTDRFIISSRLAVPLLTPTPLTEQSCGIFIGLGDQSNFLRFTVHGLAGSGGLSITREVNDGSLDGGAAHDRYDYPLDQIPGTDFIELYLSVDPVNHLVQPYYAAGEAQRNIIGTELSIPPSWTDSVLAIGVIASAGTGEAFTASWDFLSICQGSVGLMPIDTCISYSGVPSYPDRELRFFPSLHGCDSTTVREFQPTFIDTLLILESSVLTSSQESASYQWLDCGSNLSEIQGANEQSFAFPGDGHFALQVTVGGCTDTTNCIQATSPVGIPDVSDQRLRLQCETTLGQNKASISWDGPEKLSELLITDMTGRTVKSANTTQHKPVSLEITGLKPGFYLVHPINMPAKGCKLYVP